MTPKSRNSIARLKLVCTYAHHKKNQGEVLCLKVINLKWETFENGILLPNCSNLLWEKIVLNSYQEKILKFEAEGREFAKILRSLEQFIQAVKGQKNFVFGGFSDLIQLY